MKPTAITEPGAFIPAAVCAQIRWPLMQDLEASKRSRAPVDPDYTAAVALIDAIGAWFDNKKVSDVSSDVSLLDSPGFDGVGWESMTVPAASDELEITPQAVGRLLKRGALHGAKGPRSWRVCAESVKARKEGSRCRH